MQAYLTIQKDWLMWLTIESEKTEMAKVKEEMLDQTRTPFSHLIISGVVDLGCMFGLLCWKFKA
jgi:hypothetical protein